MFGRNRKNQSTQNRNFLKSAPSYDVAKMQKPLPTAAQWALDTNGGSSSQPALNLIHGYLQQDRRDAAVRQMILGQLYFICDYYLRTSNDSRKYWVNDLYEQVVHKLCESMKCSVNTLPEKLETYYGRVLGDHGYKVDHQQMAHGSVSKVAEYLSNAERLKYEIEFYQGGLAYMMSRMKTLSGYQMVGNCEVLADSTNIGWQDGRGHTAPAMMSPGYAGFALSMGRRFYMAEHRGSFCRNFFHSSYMAGDAVLCAGTILIRQGKVLAIKNDSGHYRPTVQHLLNAVQTLEMYGVDIFNLQVTAVKYSWCDDTGQPGRYDLTLSGGQIKYYYDNPAQMQERKRLNAQQQIANGTARNRTLGPPIP